MLAEGKRLLVTDKGLYSTGGSVSSVLMHQFPWLLSPDGDTQVDATHAAGWRHS